MPRSSYDTQTRDRLIQLITEKFGDRVTKEQILEVVETNGLPNPNFILANRKIKNGKQYVLSLIGAAAPVQKAMLVEQTPAPELAPVVSLRQKKLITEVDDLVPMRDADYVPFGFYRQLEKVIKSARFYPIFVTGLSGNGKTTMVEQVCAKLKRECIRVNISIETDEDDLIGGSTLVDGNITYREGPVLTAMRRGAVLLIDEIDRGSNKLMCMQSIMEGKPYFNKKTGEVVHPAAGFTIVATANTKGKGTEDGRFIAAQILDEAFLERFPITVEQEYPPASIERKIIINKMRTIGYEDLEFADKLISWAEIIRKTFDDGGVDEIISTRRLLHIVQANDIFGDQMDAIQYCINRFDADTKAAFLDLYVKLSNPVEQPLEQPAEETAVTDDFTV